MNNVTILIGLASLLVIGAIWLSAQKPAEPEEPAKPSPLETKLEACVAQTTEISQITEKLLTEVTALRMERKTLIEELQKVLTAGMSSRDSIFKTLTDKADLLEVRQKSLEMTMKDLKKDPKVDVHFTNPLQVEMLRKPPTAIGQGKDALLKASGIVK